MFDTHIFLSKVNFVKISSNLNGFNFYILLTYFDILKYKFKLSKFLLQYNFVNKLFFEFFRIFILFLNLSIRLRDIIILGIVIIVGNIKFYGSDQCIFYRYKLSLNYWSSKPKILFCINET
uniref:Uncharacterized protein n=1 Tax=Strigamia maritima TaxID=126957 RepID=T1JPG5_STRMM